MNKLCTVQKVCKHCKARIVKCPQCLEYTDGNNIKCEICGSSLNIADLSPALAAQREEDTKYYRKSFGMALFLNWVWPGWGVYNCGAEKGRTIAVWMIWAFVFFIITAFIVPIISWIPAIILEIQADIICWHYIKEYNTKLETGVLDIYGDTPVE